MFLPDYLEVDGNGNKFWYLNGVTHRVEGPAIEYADGGKHWYRNGKRHRLDGPAIEWNNGSKNGLSMIKDIGSMDLLSNILMVAKNGGSMENVIE